MGRAGINFVTGMLLARWLGPAEYGTMAFLLGTFMGFRQLLDLGSSSAFFTFLSQRTRSRRFVLAFFVWLAVQFVLALAVIGFLFPARWIALVWHDQGRGLVVLAFAAIYMQYSVWPVVQQAGESQRRTVWVQGVGLAVAGAHLLAIALLWRLRMLGLYAVFAAIAVEYLAAAVVAQRRYRHAEGGTPGGDGTSGSMVRMYWGFCGPLVPYSVVGFAYEFADRWLLQTYGGGVEQAYYAVGAQFAAVALIATTSILRIFWKEIAEANHVGNRARAGMLYRKTTRLLFAVSAIIAGFLFPWAGSLLQRILGAAYVGGATTLAIMFIYPVHQSMGQICGTMLYATERTSLQVIVGIVFMIVSMVATYFVLAPRGAVVPGLGMASEGLAIKMVVMQVVQVNVLAYLIARTWRWQFDWLHQPVSLAIFAGIGWLAHYVAAEMIRPARMVPAALVLGGAIDLTLAAGTLYALPWLGGLTRAELAQDLSHVFRLFRPPAHD